MEFTGERFTTSCNSAQITYEHWHRYLYSSIFAKGKTVLDIACGEGYGSYLLANEAEKVYGVDISEEVIDYAKDKYVRDNLHYLKGSVDNIPINGESIFDLVVSFETIEHVNELSQNMFIEEVKRLLKKNGVLIISTPNKRLYSDANNYKNEFHEKELYEQEFISLLSKYFKNVVLIYQKIFVGSNMWLNNPEGKNRPNIDYYLKKQYGQYIIDIEPEEPLYLIAVCSECDINCISDSKLIDKSLGLVIERENIMRLAIEEQKIQELGQKDQRLSAQAQEIEQKNQELGQKNQRLSVQTQEIEQKNQELGQKNQRLSVQTQEIEQKNQRLSVQTQEIDQKNQELSAQAQEIEQKNQELSAQAQEIEQKNQELEQKDQAIELITNSVSWRITKSIRNLNIIILKTNMFINRIKRKFENTKYEDEKNTKEIIQKALIQAHVTENKGKKILLVSHYCPTRAHAGGLRILDIYKIIKDNHPDTVIDIFTIKNQLYDWSYSDVENLFNNVYYSSNEFLSAREFVDITKAFTKYDIIDIQFHQDSTSLQYWALCGNKIIFTPMESMVHSLINCFKLTAVKESLKNPLFVIINLKQAFKEIRIISRVDEVVCVSEADAAIIKKVSCLNKKPITSLETGLSAIEFPILEASDFENFSTPKPGEKSNTILFVAYFGSLTNIIALKWYLNEIHAIVAKAVPDYVFQVVGRGDLSAFNNYSSENIHFVGEVDRLEPIINSAKVGIAPALGGGGFRGKINQYALYGLPTVASSISAKGLVYENGLDILVADQPQAFSDCCIKLLTDNELNLAIGQNAREKTLKTYTWASKINSIAKIYNLGDV